MAEKSTWKTFMGPMIDVYLSRHGKLFTVHRDILQSRCHLLKWALLQNSHDDEGECVGFSIGCGTPESFGLLLQWLYTGAVHHVKNVTEVILYMDATNQALALGVRDALDPLCNRVEEFYKHNVVDKIVVNAIETLPDGCKLQNALIDITAFGLCKSLRNPQVVSPDIFRSFLCAGGEPVVSLAATLAWGLNYEEDRNRHKDSTSNGRKSLTAVEFVSRAIVQAPSDMNYDTSKDTQCNRKHSFTVVASNFAAGTTVADIKRAISSDLNDSRGHNCLLSCLVTCERPSVTAELVFSNREIADRIIRRYHDRRADGRLLNVAGKWESDTVTIRSLHSKPQNFRSMQTKTGRTSPEEVSIGREAASGSVPRISAKQGKKKHFKNHHKATSFSQWKKDVTTTHASNSWEHDRRADKKPNEGQLW